MANLPYAKRVRRSLSALVLRPCLPRAPQKQFDELVTETNWDPTSEKQWPQLTAMTQRWLMGKVEERKQEQMRKDMQLEKESCSVSFLSRHASMHGRSWILDVAKCSFFEGACFHNVQCPKGNNRPTFVSSKPLGSEAGCVCVCCPRLPSKNL